MDTPQPASTPKPTLRSTSTQRKKRPRWLTMLIFSPVIVSVLSLLAQFGAFAPLFSFGVYPQLAAPGWHNISPHGNNVLDDYVTSVDDPSLMFACGASYSIFWHDSAPWRIGQLHFWRSTDSGKDWAYIAGPPLNGAGACAFAMPPGGHGIVFATLTHGGQASSAVTWVSHDAGATWRKITDATSANSAPNTFYTLTILAYRNGLLYGYHPDDFSPSADAFGVSADDGAQWTMFPGASSALQRQGWYTQPDEPPVPDYRADHAWFRTVVSVGKLPMLEHSTDDGRTWSTISAIGSKPYIVVSLATTPLAPSHLCAAYAYGETAQPNLFSSADAGATWEAGRMPASVRVASDATGPVGEPDHHLGADALGDCYEGYSYATSAVTEDMQYDVLALTPEDATVQIISVGKNAIPVQGPFFVVPSSDGAPARVILGPEALPSGSLYSVAHMADETDTGQLWWAPLPSA